MARRRRAAATLMSLEFWAAFGSVGTLVVIAVTAIIAGIQLRHIRAANQAQFIRNLFLDYEGPSFRDAFDFVRTDLDRCLQDPAYRRELRSGPWPREGHPEILALGYFENLSHAYLEGAMDPRIFMRSYGRFVVHYWSRLEPVVALLADPIRGNIAGQAFEKVTVQARRWVERHPNGWLGGGEPRIPLSDRWRDVDDRPDAAEPMR